MLPPRKEELGRVAEVRAPEYQDAVVKTKTGIQTKTVIKSKAVIHDSLAYLDSGFCLSFKSCALLVGTSSEGAFLKRSQQVTPTKQAIDFQEEMSLSEFSA